MDLDNIDDFGIYDDLDEFHEKEEKKSKELQALENKYEEALKTIEAMNMEKKDLRKKIRLMEQNLQSLLDTAKAEIKRKDKIIEELRKEKDDICFRRQRVVQDQKQYKEKWHANEVSASREASNLLSKSEKSINREGDTSARAPTVEDVHEKRKKSETEETDLDKMKLREDKSSKTKDQKDTLTKKSIEKNLKKSVSDSYSSERSEHKNSDRSCGSYKRESDSSGRRTKDEPHEKPGSPRHEKKKSSSREKDNKERTGKHGYDEYSSHRKHKNEHRDHKSSSRNDNKSHRSETHRKEPERRYRSPISHRREDNSSRRKRRNNSCSDDDRERKRSRSSKESGFLQKTDVSLSKSPKFEKIESSDEDMEFEDEKTVMNKVQPFTEPHEQNDLRENEARSAGLSSLLKPEKNDKSKGINLIRTDELEKAGGRADQSKKSAIRSSPENLTSPLMDNCKSVNALEKILHTRESESVSERTDDTTGNKTLSKDECFVEKKKYKESENTNNVHPKERNTVCEATSSTIGINDLLKDEESVTGETVKKNVKQTNPKEDEIDIVETGRQEKEEENIIEKRKHQAELQNNEEEVVSGSEKKFPSANIKQVCKEISHEIEKDMQTKETVAEDNTNMDKKESKYISEKFVKKTEGELYPTALENVRNVKDSHTDPQTCDEDSVYSTEKELCSKDIFNTSDIVKTNGKDDKTNNKELNRNTEDYFLENKDVMTNRCLKVKTLDLANENNQKTEYNSRTKEHNHNVKDLFQTTPVSALPTKINDLLPTHMSDLSTNASQALPEISIEIPVIKNGTKSEKAQNTEQPKTGETVVRITEDKVKNFNAKEQITKKVESVGDPQFDSKCIKKANEPTVQRFDMDTNTVLKLQPNKADVNKNDQIELIEHELQTEQWVNSSEEELTCPFPKVIPSINENKKMCLETKDALKVEEKSLEFKTQSNENYQLSKKNFNRDSKKVTDLVKQVEATNISHHSKKPRQSPTEKVMKSNEREQIPTLEEENLDGIKEQSLILKNKREEITLPYNQPKGKNNFLLNLSFSSDEDEVSLADLQKKCTFSKEKIEILENVCLPPLFAPINRSLNKSENPPKNQTKELEISKQESDNVDVSTKPISKPSFLKDQQSQIQKQQKTNSESKNIGGNNSQVADSKEGNQKPNNSSCTSEKNHNEADIFSHSTEGNLLKEDNGDKRRTKTSVEGHIKEVGVCADSKNIEDASLESSNFNIHKSANGIEENDEEGLHSSSRFSPQNMDVLKTQSSVTLSSSGCNEDIERSSLTEHNGDIVKNINKIEKQLDSLAEIPSENTLSPSTNEKTQLHSLKKDRSISRTKKKCSTKTNEPLILKHSLCQSPTTKRHHSPKSFSVEISNETNETLESNTSAEVRAMLIEGKSPKINNDTLATSPFRAVQGMDDLDKDMQAIFDSPAKCEFEIPTNDSLLSNVSTLSNETIDENRVTSLNVSENLNKTQDSSFEAKRLSLGSSQYVYERVSENVVNLFITRRRNKKRNNLKATEAQRSMDKT